MRIGRYEVLGEVARGGFGVVLRARDPALSREVAIKLLLAGAGANDTQRRRFEREVGALARLRHPNIVSVHEAGSIREGPYIVMDFVDGESLDQRLARLGPLPVREALRLMETVARAIEHAHTRGVLHRDLKPGNVLVDRTGTPLVTDFGLAREVDPRLSATALSRSGASLGTPGYWPPEQAYGRLADIGPRSDVYALGATLYALLTGQPPYEAPSIVELMGRMTAPPTPPSALRPEVPPALDAVVLRALAAEPAERHATAGALADALTECRRRSQGPAPRRGPSGVAVALVGAAALATTVTLALALRRPPPAVVVGEDPPAPPIPAPPLSAPPDTAPEGEGPPPAPDALALGRAAFEAGRYVDALEAAAAALEARPDDIEALLLRACARLRLDDLVEAEEDASVALALDPTRLGARRLRAEVRRARGDVQGALEDARLVLAEAIGVDRAEALAVRAWARHRLGDKAGAAEDYATAAALVPRGRWSIDGGSALLELGKVDEALAQLEVGLASEPDDVLGLVNRATCRMLRGELDLALADADRAVTLRPTLGVLVSRRGEVRRLRGELDLALTDLSRAIELDREYAETWRQRAVVRAGLKDVEGAIADYRQALALGVSPREVLPNLGLLLARTGALQEALETFDTALRLDPRNRVAYSGRADVRESLDDRVGALADLDQAIEVGPPDWSLHHNRGLLRNSVEDLEGACADYDRVLELRPDFVDALLTRGDVRRRMKDVDGALEDLARAVALAPDNPRVHLAYGLAFHARGGPEALARADEELSIYLAARPDHARILAERAFVREKLGRKEDALADFRRVLELPPEGDDSSRSFARQRIKRLEEAARPPE